MPSTHILLILSNPETSQQLEKKILAPAGFRVTQLAEWETAGALIRSDPPDLAIVNDKFGGQDALQSGSRPGSKQSFNASPAAAGDTLG